MRDQPACACRTSSAAARSAAVFVDLAADRVRRQRFLQHRREPDRRRQRRVASAAPTPGRQSTPARSSIRLTSASIRLRLASGSRSVPANAAGQRARNGARRRRRTARSSACGALADRRRAPRSPAATRPRERAAQSGRRRGRPARLDARRDSARRRGAASSSAQIASRAATRSARAMSWRWA